MLQSRLNVLTVGDIVGRPGRDALYACLDQVKQEYCIDFVIANAENVAGGFGITKKTYRELMGMGVDACTSGNHVYRKKDFADYADFYDCMVRPANFPVGSPGEGVRYFRCAGQQIAVVNLIGRVFMGLSDCPFQWIQRELPAIQSHTPIIFLDFHAEVTSEKQAMGWLCDGQVTAVYGTHTHVMTADERQLLQGTGYISDIGMVGARDTVVGMDRHASIARFIDQFPRRFSPPKDDPIQLFNAVVWTLDPATGTVVSIQRIQREVQR